MVIFENIDIDMAMKNIAINSEIDRMSLRNIDIDINKGIIFARLKPIFSVFPPDLLMEYQIFISIVDI